MGSGRGVNVGGPEPLGEGTPLPSARGRARAAAAGRPQERTSVGVGAMVDRRSGSVSAAGANRRPTHPDDRGMRAGDFREAVS